MGFSMSGGAILSALGSTWDPPHPEVSTNPPQHQQTNSKEQRAKGREHEGSGGHLGLVDVAAEDVAGVELGVDVAEGEHAGAALGALEL
eukprot:943186-Rhodomonas_salina.1